MSRLAAIALVLALAAACGRKDDPNRPEGAYASPDTATPIERAADDDPLPDVLAPATDPEETDD